MGMAGNEIGGDEKRSKILEEAVKEFGRHGYGRSSTNAIIKGAGVSKGLLFHYFGTKKDLCLAAYDDAMIFSEEWFDRHIGNLSRDLIDRVLEVQMMKLQFGKEYPDQNRLVTKLVLEGHPEIAGEVNQRTARMYEKYIPQLMENLDEGLFRDQVEPRQAFTLLNFVMEGLAARIIKDYQLRKTEDDLDLNAYVAELKTYFEMIKHGIYR